MSEGLFAGLDLENAADNPFQIPTDWYDLILSDVQVKSGKKDTTRNYLVVEWTIQGGNYDGDTMQQWRWLPKPTDEETKEVRQAKAYLKQFLLNIGIPESRHDVVGKDDLMNIEVSALCVENNGFTSPSNKPGEFKLRDGLHGSAPVADNDSDGMSVFAGDKDE